jgi:hypothetical protein
MNSYKEMKSEKDTIDVCAATFLGFLEVIRL